MKLLSILFTKTKQEKKKKLEDLQQEALSRQGREQFRKLKEIGLQIPIVLL
jgi:hypothetical protein